MKRKELLEKSYLRECKEFSEGSFIRQTGE